MSTQSRRRRTSVTTHRSRRSRTFRRARTLSAHALRANLSQAKLLGDLQRFPVADLIEFLVSQRARGVLTVFSNGQAPVSLTIWEGRFIGRSIEKELRGALTSHHGLFAFEELAEAGEGAWKLGEVSVDARKAVFDAFRRLDEESRTR
jgi:hypothetical protein